MKKIFCKHSAFYILHSAFTLIELLIVMVVIAILVGITIPVSKYVTYRARMANQKIYVEKIKSALEDYRAAYGEYPITPTKADGTANTPDDVQRHYPANFDTTIFDTNSPFTSVPLAATSVEWISADVGSPRGVDYSLTYPLMLKQRAEGARPFMEFKDVTVAYLVTTTPGAGDIFPVTRIRKLKGGLIDITTKEGVWGRPVNRPEAIDPVTMKQWKYNSDGVTYTLTNHTESGF